MKLIQVMYMIYADKRNLKEARKTETRIIKLESRVIKKLRT